jgi:hypothetical protein
VIVVSRPGACEAGAVPGYGDRYTRIYLRDELAEGGDEPPIRFRGDELDLYAEFHFELVRRPQEPLVRPRQSPTASRLGRRAGQPEPDRPPDRRRDRLSRPTAPHTDADAHTTQRTATPIDPAPSTVQASAAAPPDAREHFLQDPSSRTRRPAADREPGRRRTLAAADILSPASEHQLCSRPAGGG